MANWNKVYNHLPHPLRVLAANARGYYLRWWRYGPEMEGLVEEALEKETWSPERLKIWQEERLTYVLHRAATQVPYYREYWLQQRRHGNRASWERLEHWPILKKEMLRENPLAFVARDCNARRMFVDRTGGTTGTPVSIYIRKKTLRQYYALNEARMRRWHGIVTRERWAMLGGQQIIPFNQKNPPFWVFNLGLNQLYLSTYHLSAKNVKWYINALYRYNPTHMIAYPSSAFILAVNALDKALFPPQMKVIFSNAELLMNSHKEIISEAFRCPVRNAYGQGELVTSATECERGGMHIWPEMGIIEVFDDEQDVLVKEGEVGRLILTGLLNADMPLIRYEVGDRGSLELPGKKCPCRRNLPLLSRVEGRMNDMIVTPDGRRIFWLNPVFYGLPIREAQIIQEKLDRVRVYYVAAQDFTLEAYNTIIDRLHSRIGDVQIILEQVNEIPRGANKKFRAVISQLSNADLNSNKELYR